VSLLPVEQSLELAAERAGDLTPLIYARLFAQSPEMEAMFWRDTNGKIKGEMLAQVFEAILDFVGTRQYADKLIQCEVVNHAEYNVPPEVFRTFFGVVAATIREVLGAAWTPEYDAAWSTLLDELDYYVTHPNQAETARR
jgi:hemoglobin-like flavoprotein